MTRTPPIRAWAVAHAQGITLTSDATRAQQIAPAMHGVISRLFNAEALLADKAAGIPCRWGQDSDESDCWATDCQQAFSLNEGTPVDNGMLFCCFCGKPIEQVPYSDDDELTTAAP